jgi:hypothetical protein
MNFSNRAIHRDLGYIYVGLIISFALSGIMMNHREHWHPEKYTISSQPITVVLPAKEAIDEEYVAKMLKNELKIHDKFKRHMVKKGTLKIFCENHAIEIDLKTGSGEIIKFQKTPLISQIMTLHKSSSNWWIYYSDVFGLSLITIALTGIFIIPKGKNSFRQRGWKLALAGILFPIIIVVFVL